MLRSTLLFLLVATLASRIVAYAQDMPPEDFFTREYNGNIIKLADSPFQSVFYLSDPRIPLESDHWREHRYHDFLPIKLNGDSIYYDPPHEAFMGGYSLTTHILSQLQTLLSELADGEYVIRLGCVVVDTGGSIVYYTDIGNAPDSVTQFGIARADSRGWSKEMLGQRKKINAQLIALLKEVKMYPAEHYGHNVPCVLLHPMATKTIVVAEHKVIFL